MIYLVEKSVFRANILREGAGTLFLHSTIARCLSGFSRNSYRTEHDSAEEQKLHALQKT